MAAYAVGPLEDGFPEWFKPNEEIVKSFISLSIRRNDADQILRISIGRIHFACAFWNRDVHDSGGVYRNLIPRHLD